MNTEAISNAKAALYRTAMVSHDTEMFKAGEFVQVIFIPAPGRGSKRFRCYGVEYPACECQRNFEVLYDYDLKRFCL